MRRSMYWPSRIFLVVVLMLGMNSDVLDVYVIENDPVHTKAGDFGLFGSFRSGYGGIAERILLDLVLKRLPGPWIGKGRSLDNQYLGEIFHRLARQKECWIDEGHLMFDHVHMMISIPPKYSVAQVIGFLKGKSAIYVASEVLENAES